MNVFLALLMGSLIHYLAPSEAHCSTVKKEEVGQGMAQARISFDRNDRVYLRDAKNLFRYIQSTAALSVMVSIEGDGIFQEATQGIVVDDELVPGVDYDGHSTLEIFPHPQGGRIVLSVAIIDFDIEDNPSVVLSVNQEVVGVFVKGDWQAYERGEEVQLKWEVPIPQSLAHSKDVSWITTSHVAKEVQESVESWADDDETLRPCWKGAQPQSQKATLTLGPSDAFISGPYPVAHLSFVVGKDRECPFSQDLDL